MAWAQAAKEALLRGETIVVTPRGHSMPGKVGDGEQVTLTPCLP